MKGVKIQMIALETMENFNTTSESYKLICDHISKVGLLEDVRQSIDYSILKEHINSLSTLEDKWNTYGLLVVDNAKSELNNCLRYIIDNYNLDANYVVEGITYRVIYTTFIGFATETGNILEQLIANGYTPIDDEQEFAYMIGGQLTKSSFRDYIDSKFSLDLRAIAPNGKIVGIQFKSESYLNLSFLAKDKYNNSIKESHHKKHQKAIGNGFVSEVYFVFHRANSLEILTLEEEKPYFAYEKGEYLIKSHHITTLNKYGKPYIKHKDFVGC